MEKAIAIVSFLTFFFVIQSLNAQTILGQVTVEELSKQSSDFEPGAPAEILSQKGEYRLMFTSEGSPILIKEIEKKIKIYTKEGYQWANHRFQVYAKGKGESSYYSDAFTYNLVDGKIVKSKLKKENEYSEQIDEKWVEKRMAMPDVKEGSVIEFKYTVKTPYFFVFDWDFQHRIPVLKSELVLQTNEFFMFNFRTKFFSDFIKEEVSLKFNGSPYNEIKTIYKASQIPSIKDEPFVINSENYRGAIIFELASIKYPNGVHKHFSSSWEEVSRSIFLEANYKNEINSCNYCKKDIADLLNSSLSAQQKLVAAFEFVKNHMNWDGKNSYFTDRGVSNAYKERVGNSADINLMLISILRCLGFEANPVLVSTSDNGIAIFPSITSYNYIIASAKINDNWYLLDATSKYTSPNLLPLRALNWFGRMIEKNGNSHAVDFTPKTPAKSITTAVVTITKEGNIDAKQRHQLFDHYAYLYREKNAGLDKKTLEDNLLSKFPNLEIINFNIQNIDELSKPIVEEVHIQSNSWVLNSESTIIFNPFFSHQFNENPFKLESRQHPIEFVFPRSDKFMFTYVIPSGFVIETLPEPLHLSLLDNSLVLKYHISSFDDKIQLAASVDVNNTIIASTHYELVKEFFAKVVEKLNEQIVLKKV
jgi:hypothetical protein